MLLRDWVIMLRRHIDSGDEAAIKRTALIIQEIMKANS